jgi:hypothetical protein
MPREIRAGAWSIGTPFDGDGHAASRDERKIRRATVIEE